MRWSAPGALRPLLDILLGNGLNKPGLMGRQRYCIVGRIVLGLGSCGIVTFLEDQFIYFYCFIYAFGKIFKMYFRTIRLNYVSPK